MPDDKYEQMLHMYWSCFRTAEGMEVLRDLRNQFFNSIMVDEDCNPNTLLFREGRRAVVIHILAAMEEYEQLMAEKLKVDR